MWQCDWDIITDKSQELSAQVKFLDIILEEAQCLIMEGTITKHLALFAPTNTKEKGPNQLDAMEVLQAVLSAQDPPTHICYLNYRFR